MKQLFIWENIIILICLVFVFFSTRYLHIKQKKFLYEAKLIKQRIKLGQDKQIVLDNINKLREKAFNPKTHSCIRKLENKYYIKYK